MAYLDETGLTRLWSKITNKINKVTEPKFNTITGNILTLTNRMFDLEKQTIDSDRVVKLESIFQEDIRFESGSGFSMNPCELEKGENYQLSIKMDVSDLEYKIVDENLTAFPFELEGMELGLAIQNEKVGFIYVYEEYRELLSDGIPVIIEILEVEELFQNLTNTATVTVQKATRVTEQLEEEIDNLHDVKIEKFQGISNFGKILMVDASGNLTLADMPEVGVKGDIVGVVSENNQIVLTGVLPEGVYTLKYEMEDGTVLDIGSLNLASEQVVPIILSYGKIDYSNNGAIVSSDTYLYSDAITRETNKTYTIASGGEGAACDIKICYYDANDNYLGISENVYYRANSDTYVTGAWAVPLVSEAKKFRLRIYHSDNTKPSATKANLTLIKQNLKYTNLLPLATDASGNVLNGCGYKVDYRMSNYPADFSKDTSGTTGYFTTGLIPYTNAQLADRVPFYVKGIDIDLTNLSQHQYLRFTMLNPSEPSVWRGNITMTDITNINQFHIQKLGDKYYRFTPNSNAKYVNEWNKYDLTHCRWNFPGSGAGVIITVDEPIE